MSSLLTILLRDECQKLCSKCLVRHFTNQSQSRGLHRTELLRNKPQQTVPKVNRTTKKRKLAYILGLSVFSSGIYYVSLDEPDRRKIRVLIGGVGRFLR